MKIGDLVKVKLGQPSKIGIIERIDKDYYGAQKAFKIYRKIERGKCIRPGMVDGFGTTKNGIHDRVLVCWPDTEFPEYYSSLQLTVVS